MIFNKASLSDENKECNTAIKNVLLIGLIWCCEGLVLDWNDEFVASVSSFK